MFERRPTQQTQSLQKRLTAEAKELRQAAKSLRLGLNGMRSCAGPVRMRRPRIWRNGLIRRA
jgi:hypothetical protein